MTDKPIYGGEEEVIPVSKSRPSRAMEYSTDDQRLLLLEKFHGNPYLAHDIIFESRRKDKSPEFDKDILDLFYSHDQKVLAEAFRGAGKSTRGEEYAILELLFQRSKFALLIGNTYDSACQRLATIKYELENNENIIELFGNQVGPTWTYDTIVLSGGQRIQAFGARQSLRGAKTDRNDRPDLAVVDDLEDEDNVMTEQARNKTRRWFDGSLVPALIPKGKIRMVGTPLHPKALLEEKRNSKEWKSLVVPICYIKDGREVASWPARFPMKWIEQTRHNFMEAGSITEFEQEYMCRAEDKASKPFQPEMFRRGVPAPGHRIVEIMVDPARTVNLKTSARTGYAVWSWLGNQLTVLKAYGAFHKPDEIINEIFKLNEEYSPWAVGVEKDGLEEFIMQPLRHEQLKRGETVPIVPLKAPKDKQAFISGLQAFYMAGDVIHTDQCRDLEQELLAFPTGRVDVANALAYAPKMRSGKPVYEDFGPQHIFDNLQPHKKAKRYLAVSATPAMVAAVLLQYRDNNLYVIKDWVRNEPAIEGLPIILQEATLEAGEFITVTPAEQMDKYTNNGIPSVFKGRRNKIIRGNLASTSVGCIGDRLKTTNKGVPAFQVSSEAKWVINGMARGYSRKMQSDGSYEDLPERNQYSLAIEAIESFTSYVKNGMLEGDDELTRAMTSSGREYYSSIPPKGR